MLGGSSTSVNRYMFSLLHGTALTFFMCVGQVHNVSSLRQIVYTHRASVHQAAKLVTALFRVARVTAGLVESNGSPVLGSQPAGDVSHKPGGRLPLLRQAYSYPRNP